MRGHSAARTPSTSCSCDGSLWTSSRRQPRRSIWLLSHVGSHPNIFFYQGHLDQAGSGRTAPALVPLVAGRARAHAPGRRSLGLRTGTLGECLDVLLYEDPNIVRKLHLAITLLLKDPDHTQAVRAATLALTHSKDQRKELALLISDFPALMEHEWFQEIAVVLEESPERFALY